MQANNFRIYAEISSVYVFYLMKYKAMYQFTVYSATPLYVSAEISAVCEYFL